MGNNFPHIQILSSNRVNGGNKRGENFISFFQVKKNLISELYILEVCLMKIGVVSNNTDLSHVFDLEEIIQKSQQDRFLSNMVIPDRILDCRLLSSPLPIIKLRCEMRKIKVGQILELLVTDLESIKFVPQWCNRTGNDFIEITGNCGVTRFVIQHK